VLELDVTFFSFRTFIEVEPDILEEYTKKRVKEKTWKIEP